MVEGRSKQVFKAWLAERDQAWRDAVEVVAMDGFSGFKTATTEELPDAVAVMDPFHVVRLAGDALDKCRRRIQQDIHGHRGRAAHHHTPPTPPIVMSHQTAAPRHPLLPATQLRARQPHPATLTGSGQADSDNQRLCRTHLGEEATRDTGSPTPTTRRCAPG